MFAFHPHADGSLWLDTGAGLMRIRDGAVQDYTRRAGCHGDAVFAILDDHAGNFWVRSNRGIARLAQAELAALDSGERSQIEPTWFGKDDGMLSSQANGASQTPAWRTLDGRMWFGTANGVVMVDPERMASNLQAPPVAVERLVVNGEDLDLERVGAIAPGVERIELHYAAMSNVAPAAVRYRYRIEGLNRDWIEAGANRIAHYTNLILGEYLFRIVGSNNDEVWNVERASLRFVILPSWHET